MKCGVISALLGLHSCALKLIVDQQVSVIKNEKVLKFVLDWLVFFCFLLQKKGYIHL